MRWRERRPSMRWREAMTLEPMSRVALVAPRRTLRAALVRTADSGVMEFDRITEPGDRPLPDVDRVVRSWTAGHGPTSPRLAAEPADMGGVDLDAWERGGRIDLIAGEAELTEHAADAVTHDEVAALLGWVPTGRLPALNASLAPVGAAAVPLPRPSGVDPPTAERSGPVRHGLFPLVRTYAEVPYADADPTLPATLAYLVMFGAMFGDVGHGALLLVGAFVLRAGLLPRLAKLRRYWLSVAGAGLSSAGFGLLYGEAFGPTGWVPTVWLSPLEHPVPLLLAGVGLGFLLLAGSYALGTVNRFREGGWGLALYDPSGVAGTLLFLAAGLATASWYGGWPWPGYTSVGLAVVALGLTFTGLLVSAGGGPTGVLQATVELFDTVIRLGANVVSFARLAAFGLTHAVLGWIVWDATTALWGRGAPAAGAAVVVFVLGNAVAFALEALVAGVQALRLEYYELFSRVFRTEGRPFRPWHIPTAVERPPEETSCPPG